MPQHQPSSSLEPPPARQLRARPIDVNKKLCIIRSLSDIQKFSEGEHGIRVDPVSLGFLSNGDFVMENFNEITKTKEKNIAIPKVQFWKENTQSLFKYEKPDHFIRYETHKDHVSGEYLDDGSIIHFFILREDEKFLRELNKQCMALNMNSRPLISEMEFCKMIDTFEKESGKSGDSAGEICFDEALKTKEMLGFSMPSHIVKEIYNHWKERRATLGRSLIRMFWAQTHIHDTSPFAVFRPRTKDKMTLRRPKRNQGEVVQKLESLVDEFKKIEKIIKKIKQRDEKKLCLMEINELIFEQLRHEAIDPTYKVPQWNYLRENRYDKMAKRARREKERQQLDNQSFSSITAYPSPFAAETTGNPHIRHISSPPYYLTNESPFLGNSGGGGGPVMVSPSPDFSSNFFNGLSSSQPLPPAGFSRFESSMMRVGGGSPNLPAVGEGLPYFPTAQAGGIGGQQFHNFNGLAVLRRRGRGGRVWLDRKVLRYSRNLPLENSPLSFPEGDTDKSLNSLNRLPIYGAHDGFEAYQLTNYAARQIQYADFIESTLSLDEDSHVQIMRPHTVNAGVSIGPSSEEYGRRYPRDGREWQQSFGAWIKNALPIPVSNERNKISMTYGSGIT